MEWWAIKTLSCDRECVLQSSPGHESSVPVRDGASPGVKLPGMEPPNTEAPQRQLKVQRRRVPPPSKVSFSDKWTFLSNKVYYSMLTLQKSTTTCNAGYKLKVLSFMYLLSCLTWQAMIDWLFGIDNLNEVSASCKPHHSCDFTFYNNW